MKTTILMIYKKKDEACKKTKKEDMVLFLERIYNGSLRYKKDNQRNEIFNKKKSIFGLDKDKSNIRNNYKNIFK